MQLLKLTVGIDPVGICDHKNFCEYYMNSADMPFI